MSNIKIYNLPHGRLLLNKGTTMQAIFDKSGNPVFLKPGGTHFEGSLKGVGFETYFLNPDFWDVRIRANEIIEEKGKVDVLLKIDEIDRYGDHVLFTIFPAAVKYTYSEKANVDVLLQRKFADVWKGNDDVREVFTSDPNKEYDVTLDGNGLELKFKPTDNLRCSDQLLKHSKLYLANKTPKYSISEEDKEFAVIEVMGLGRPLVGVGFSASGKCREYPRMDKVQHILNDKGYGTIQLDEVMPNGKYRYSFREMASVINECDVVVSADSAIIHLAGALKKKIVGVFGSTDGAVTTENYEKAIVVQGECSIVKEPCWWDVPCIKGITYQEKEKKANTPCLLDLNPELVIEAVDEQLLNSKKLLLCMLTYNLLDMTKRAVDSIRSHHDYDLFVVDNESDDGTGNWLKGKGIEYVSKRTSVSAAQNIGLQKFLEGNYDHFILLNNDIVLRYDTIDKLVDCAEETGAYGVMSSQVPSMPNWAVDSAKAGKDRHDVITNIPAGSYSCTLLSKRCIERVGFFNERFTPRYIEDNDYTLRMRIDGGLFVKSQAAIYWHYLGGVVKNVKGARDKHEENWNKNIGIFYEIYGFHPHDDQRLEKLGPEWRRDFTADSIESFIHDNGSAIVNVTRFMGGYGDILFTTVIARELKKLFGDKVEITYSVPEEFKSLLEGNPNIDKVFGVHKKTSADFRLDLTDLEFRTELQEMQKYGEIKSARTEIYLNTIGLSSDLKPDYFVTEEEAKYGEEQWKWCAPNFKRIVISAKGSNKLKEWTGMDKLWKKLSKHDVMLFNLENKGKYLYSFREAAAIISKADCVVSPDSGISNLAATLGIPTVTIFSNRNKDNFEKMFKTMIGIQGHCPHNEEQDYCDFFCPCFGVGPHRSKENIRIPDCLKALTADEVYNKVMEVIDG